MSLRNGVGGHPMARWVMVLCAVSVCAAASEAGAQNPRPPKRNRDLITREEISAASGSTAFDVVQQLRSSWLSRPVTVGPSGDASPIVVYVDRHRVGGLEELHNIPSEQVESIRWVAARDATTRYGTGHASGVIEVMTRRG